MSSVDLDLLVEQKRKRKAEEIAALPIQGSSAQSHGAQPSGSQSGAAQPAAGATSLSQVAPGQPAAPQHVAGAPSVPPAPSVSAPQHAFTEEQSTAFMSFSKPNLLAIARQLPIANIDDKTTVSQLRIRIDRLFGRFTNLVVDANKGTIEFDAFEEQLFQQPAASSPRQSAR